MISSNSPNTAPHPRASVVVVDDEENMGKILSKILTQANYQVTAFTDPAAAIGHIRESSPNLVLTDMRMPGLTGLDVLRAARATNQTTSVVLMTGYGTIEGAIEAMRSGAFDYITKPFKTDDVLQILARAMEQSRLAAETDPDLEALCRQSGIDEIVGESEQIREVTSLITKIAPTDAAVLIRGESGTGKELCAKAIHEQSLRRKKRFMAINCASIPDALLESELFGHEKGAFTGADRAKAGLVELAHGGTLFLDEIGDLPLPLQAKILRVLQEREIQRVGGVQTIAVDIRLIAATNRDLAAAIATKDFRSDLYYRLNVITITMPPLRDRPTDVGILAESFLDYICGKMGRRRIGISPEALAALGAYSFPGNVRELQNIIERAVVLCSGETIGVADLPMDLRHTRAGMPAPATGGRSVEYREAKDSFERIYLLKIIEEAKGNISEAARLSGLSRRHFYEKLEKLGIKTDK